MQKTSSKKEKVVMKQTSMKKEKVAMKKTVMKGAFWRAAKTKPNATPVTFLILDRTHDLAAQSSGNLLKSIRNLLKIIKHY